MIYGLICQQSFLCWGNIQPKGDEKVLVLEELKRTLAPYRAKLTEMGNSL